ncbi:hypothetical protein [Thalassotalea litorea]|uniref:hypothetical protein n=1 Tax=Thalassotalea litorea TaxID=2020715 RepID=UPI003734C66E
MKKACLIIPLLILTLLASSYGLANIYFKQAEVRVKRWQIDTQLINEEDYRQALDYANKALLFHSGHNQYLEIKAQILEWGADEGIGQPRATALRQAKQLYLQSTSTRPTWPGTWAALAMLKWRMQEFDMEMVSYLKNAYAVGKNSPEVKLAYQQLGPVLRDYYPQLFASVEASYNLLGNK